jgi:hypothetical protein
MVRVRRVVERATSYIQAGTASEAAEEAFELPAPLLWETASATTENIECCQVREAAPPPPRGRMAIWWVGLYRHERRLGGDQEGGWFYDRYTLERDAEVLGPADLLPTAHPGRERAWASLRANLAKLDELNGDHGQVPPGRHCYQLLVFEHELPRVHPAQRPEYRPGEMG